MIEIVTTLAIMSIAMSIFTTGILQIYRFVNKTESMSITQSQINLAVLRLDKELRYAAGISTPGLLGADWYVEYLTTNTGTATCTGLRLTVTTTQPQLQLRTWPQGTYPSPAPGWATMASEVNSTQPFTVIAPDQDVAYQRLRLTLTASAGTAPTATATQTDVTFTALDTSLGTSNTTVCSEGRVIP